MKEPGILEETIRFSFGNKDLLREALTHRSYLNEDPNWNVPHNERLEYLGDAVLELVVSEYLFKRFPQYPEGQLTVIRAALVNYQSLAETGKNIDIEEYIYMSRGEKGDNQKAREAILANAVEALIGAVYLDAGFEKAGDFIQNFILVRTDEVIRTESYKDPKSRLQEVVQERMRETPTYEVLEETGPAHERIFRVGVRFNGDIAAEGEGMSKQEAEVEAAKKALGVLEG